MSAPAIAVEGLSKQFGGLRAVDAVSLEVRAGERRALIGPNGAGKTTLFHCITGTLRASAGRVLLFGADVTRLPERRRTALGMARTFQITNVFTELTLRENVILAMLGTSPRKWVMHRGLRAFPELGERAAAALDSVGLAGRADATVDRLSYGERRQLELALALAASPKVLFLDEPCAGLSPSERQRFSRLIEELPRSITLVMIEHDMDVALGLADQVSVLHHGEVIFDGPPGAVAGNAEVREVYFGNA